MLKYASFCVVSLTDDYALHFEYKYSEYWAMGTTAETNIKLVLHP